MIGPDFDWPFDDPPNTAVITNIRILDGQDWVQYVVHDSDDGTWQFLPSHGEATVKEAAVIALDHIISLDPTLRELADLAPGWRAWRESNKSEWIREIDDAP